MRAKNTSEVKRGAAHRVLHVDRLVGSVVQEPAHEQNVPFCGGPVEGCHKTQITGHS